MSRIRYTMLVPSRTDAQRAASQRFLGMLRTAFPDGGTWLAQSTFNPVVWGWWYDPSGSGKSAPDIDSHVMISVDEMCDDPLNTTTVDWLANAFCSVFREPFVKPEVVIYILTQDIVVHERSGLRGSGVAPEKK